MSDQIGFVILSHNNPKQLHRLIHSLQRIYRNPPISVHHDFSQSPIKFEDFPADVPFVKPHVKTRWAHFSVVLAALRALELLYANANPRWFFLLSGADYPVMAADNVFSELLNSEFDALLDYRELGSLEPPGNPALSYYVTPANVPVVRGWYVNLKLSLPVIRKGPRIGRKNYYLPMQDWRSPFDSQFRCFYGDHWFAGNRKVASILLNPTEKHLQLRRHLTRRPVPEECYYQSVLANTGDLKISKSTRRFVDWKGGLHPQTLNIAHFDEIKRSKAYFARKFAPDSPVLNEIDRFLAAD
jgi:hypothetical protein